MADEVASWPRADPDYEIRFPLDEGSHPAFAGEWWYTTGWLDTSEQPLGFQVTFFRFRQKVDTAVPERTTPAQVLVGHAALSDPRRGSALHDQRAVPAEPGRAEARQGMMDVRIGDWSLRKEGEAYVALFPARDFELDLRFSPTQPPVLHGQRGFSQKAPDSTVASHYYSVPQLQVSGTVKQQGRSTPVTGTAWLDREWFTAPSWITAASWDWIGINLSDGGALMASRIRDHEGRRSWAFGSYRDAAGRLSVFEPGDIAFAASRTWRSPRTDVVYPVEWRVRAGDLGEYRAAHGRSGVRRARERPDAVLGGRGTRPAEWRDRGPRVLGTDGLRTAAEVMSSASRSHLPQGQLPTRVRGVFWSTRSSRSASACAA